VGLKGNFTPALYTALTAYQIQTSDALVQRDNGCQTSNPACPVQADQLPRKRRRPESGGSSWKVLTAPNWSGGRLRLMAALRGKEGEFTAGRDVGKESPVLPDGP
jgi:hypothetical protein